MRNVSARRRKLQSGSGNIVPASFHSFIQLIYELCHLVREITGSRQSVTYICFRKSVPVPAISVPVILILSHDRLSRKMFVKAFICSSVHLFRCIHILVRRHQIKIRVAICHETPVSAVPHRPIGMRHGKSRGCCINARITDRTATDRTELLDLTFHHLPAGP